MRTIGFQGLRGAYSEMAIMQAFGNAAVRPKAFPSFDAVFTALAEAALTDALLPVENSVAGMIHENLDGMDRYPVRIVAEEIFSVQHCLLVVPGTPLSAIETVISHPQALAQCSEFLRKRAWEPQAFFDTAGAAQHLGEQKPAGVAAIASAQAAKLYGLEIAGRNIADSSDNLTRFLHLKRETRRPLPPVTSKKGSRLLSMLALRSDEGFGRIACLAQLLQNVGLSPVHCEARPSRLKAWRYVYFLEVAGGPEHPAWQAALDATSSLVESLKVLGTYWSKR